MMELFLAAAADRAMVLERSIHLFRECGVEIERFSIMELPNGVTHLCVDRIPRVSWRLA